MDWSSIEQDIITRFGDKQPMAQKIRHMILAAISTRALPPGTRLIESELGPQLSVSRTPLREAMARLHADGILQHDDQGLRVRQLDWSDVSNLYEMRATLEGMAARQAATSAKLAERNVINTINLEEKEMIKNQASASDLAKINTRFHDSILAAANNPFLTEGFERLSRLLILLGATAYSLPQRVAEIETEHHAINQAIQENRPQDAELNMQDHLNHGLEARLILMAKTNTPHLD